MIDTNKVNCPLCDSKSFVDVYEDNPSKIVRCRNCDLVFFNPQPSLEYLRKFYSSHTGYMTSIEENLRSFEHDPESWKATAEFIFQLLNKHLKVKKGQRILDVGCAYGFFLLFAKERGLDAHGIEISSETSKYARDQGVQVHNTTLLEAQLEVNSFDFVTLNNVLEHTINPVAELSKARGLLKKEGIVFIAVPNFGSLVAQVDGYYWKMKSWPNHLFYFTEKSLTAILEKAGFAVVETFTHPGESEYTHDVRVIRDRLILTDPQQIQAAIQLLWKFGKGQELVILARKV